jgi:hypothetical protein
MCLATQLQPSTFQRETEESDYSVFSEACFSASVDSHVSAGSFLCSSKHDEGMNTQLQGIRWAIETQTAKSVWDFDRIYRSCEFNMPLACSSFFEQAGIEFKVDRNWSIDAGSVLFFSQHSTVLDGFALPLACPQALALKRVIFAITGLMLGKPFMQRNILVYPKGSYRNLLFRNSGLWNRIIYFATHRWGPFAPNHTATTAICQTLEKGACISMLPSGIIGERRWRSGIGAVVLETQSTLHPVYAAPVYLDWNESAKRVLVQSPGLIGFDTLLEQTGGLNTRDEVAQWMQDRYENRSWEYDLSKARR